MKRNQGVLIDLLKNGIQAATRHENPYLKEALNLADILYTESEIFTEVKPSFLSSYEKTILEIGCYMGKNIVEMSQNNPALNFIGCDITYKRVVKAARKIKNHKIQNAKIILCDGEKFILDAVPLSSLGGICIFFPDPWPKEKHEKNRIMDQEFVLQILHKLAPNGFFWFKSDSKAYFDHTCALMWKNGFQKTELNVSCCPEILKGGPYETQFQKMFQEKGVPFYECVFLKSS